MYQFHIKPIFPTNAPARITAIYNDIQDILKIESVPLVFQYMANYERYLVYIWERMRANLLSDEFYKSCKEVRSFSLQAVSYMETPSQELSQFVHSIHPAEASYIRQTVDKLDATNLKMMLLMIGVRESIKGIVQTRTVLPGVAEKDTTQSVEELLQMKRISHENNAEVTKAARMLAPLLGNNTIMISRYPDFFAFIADEIERLENMEAYLLTRVGLEHLGFAYIEQFVTPLNCSYKQFMELTEGTSYVDEILYLLKDTFPSRFPHLVLTTAVMKKALLNNPSSVTVT